MDNPSKIVENGITYSLGDFDGTTMHYDFYRILEYLEVKGKLLYGEEFKIFKIDRPLIRKLCAYTINDSKAANYKTLVRRLTQALRSKEEQKHALLMCNDL